MKFTSVIVTVGLASLVSSQVIYNSNGTFTCPVPNGAYCAGAAGGTDIIIRCINGTGYAGNCNDNLAGEPPIGVGVDGNCFDCGASSGRAACTKESIVYPDSGTGLGSATFLANNTSICLASSNSSGAPLPSGVNPGGPIINATYTPSGSSGAVPSATSSLIPYTGAANVQLVGAGALVGLGAVFAALGMM